jgi:pyruvate/2-oxoglutarate dehydrogenase complex dihydrolipoamide acyltransferase (E2) component
MRQVPFIMPQLGESIAEATIIRFLVDAGVEVTAGQDVIEVETSKATMTVAAPANGKVLSWSAVPEQSYVVGAKLGLLQVSAAEAEKLGLAEEGAPSSQSSTGAESAPDPLHAHAKVEPTVRGLPVPANATGASYMSPRMKARIHELGLHAADMAGVAGSGAGGRVTIQDFELFLSSLEKHRLTQASTMRVAVADAMRRSWARPLATVGLPVKLDALLEHRRSQNPKPGPALYALRALALALAENSAPAGRLIGNKIVHPPAIDIGFAVEAEDGVLVPVIRGVDKKSLAELTQRYNELVELARQRRLPPDATGGSIATVTNFGTFGLTWATPIPLPEQTLVLGLGAGRKAPCWDEAEKAFVPVMEANLTLSFDHRVLDGGGAGRLLSRLAQLLEDPTRL